MQHDFCIWTTSGDPWSASAGLQRTTAGPQSITTSPKNDDPQSTTGPISISTSTSIGHQTSDHENEQEISSVHSESDEYNSSYDETCSLQTPPYSPVL